MATKHNSNINTTNLNATVKSRATNHKIIPEPTTKDIERFCNNVNIKGPDDCWEWNKSVGPSGYASIVILKSLYLAHRVSYTIVYGSIPDGLIICHKCDNRKCVNPYHLYAGTLSDNAVDREKRNISSGYHKPTYFWDRVNIKEPDQCWEWLGPKINGYESDSYGTSGGKAAHRVSYIMTYGEIPEDKIVRHKCDLKSCVNPNHLELGTYKDNAQDRYRNAENNKLFKLNEDQVNEIRKLRQDGIKVVDIAKIYKISTSSVYDIIKRRSWNHLEEEYNNINQTRATIPFKTIQKARELYESGSYSQTKIAELYGIDCRYISQLLNYKRRKYS